MFIDDTIRCLTTSKSRLCQSTVYAQPNLIIGWLCEFDITEGLSMQLFTRTQMLGKVVWIGDKKLSDDQLPCCLRC